MLHLADVTILRRVIDSASGIDGPQLFCFILAVIPDTDLVVFKKLATFSLQTGVVGIMCQKRT